MDHVFGTCVYVDPAGIFAFYRVAGSVNEDGVWGRIPHVKEQFPNRGTIRIIHSELGVRPSRIGNVGLFEVSEDPNFDHIAYSPNAAKYRAVRIISGIFQLLQVRFTVEEIDEVSALLKRGVDILGEITSRTKLYVQLRDGIIAGPLELTLKTPDDPHSTLYVLAESSVLAVTPAWKSPTAIRTFDVRVPQRYEATFVGPHITAPEFYVDFAPLEFSLKKVLDALHNQKRLDATFTKAKRTAVAQALASIQSHPETKGRIDTVLRQLDRAAKLDAEFTRLVSEALRHPTVESRIAAAIEQAKLNAVAEIGRTESAARTNVKKLQENVEKKEEHIRELEAKRDALALEIHALETERVAAANRIEVAVREQFQAAAENSVALLSKIAVLRPFLSAPTNAHTETPPSISFPPQQFTCSEVESTPLREPREAFKHLARNLQEFGMSPPRAIDWSCEILAAVLVGQAISFRGSMSSLVADAVGLSLFGNAKITIEVPVGSMDFIRLQPMRDALNASGPWGVVVQGANRSCLDAFGGELVEHALRRSWMTRSSEILPLVIFSLREGPSTIVPTSKYSELGPVFHTDAVSWRTCPGNRLAAGSIECARMTPDPAGEADLDMLSPVLVGRNSAMFLANAKSAFTALQHVRGLVLPTVSSPDTLAKQALQSIARWWMLPFLVATDCPRADLGPVEDLAHADDTFAAHMNLLFPIAAK